MVDNSTRILLGCIETNAVVPEILLISLINQRWKLICSAYCNRKLSWRFWMFPGCQCFLDNFYGLCTPWKINMEHNHRGLVQIIFLSKWVICMFQPLIFQGVTTHNSQLPCQWCQFLLGSNLTVGHIGRLVVAPLEGQAIDIKYI